MGGWGGGGEVAPGEAAGAEGRGGAEGRHCFLGYGFCVLQLVMGGQEVSVLRDCFPEVGPKIMH